MIESIVDQTRLSIQNVVQEKKKARIKKTNKLSYTSSKQMMTYRSTEQSNELSDELSQLQDRLMNELS